MTSSAGDRQVHPGYSESDAPELVTRPRTLEEFVGQQKLCENLRVFISAASERQESLDHVLLAGPPGLGGSPGRSLCPAAS